MKKHSNNVDASTQNIFALAGDEDVDTPFEWDDMPKFEQDEFEAFHMVNVRFRNEQDLHDFCALIGQNFSSKIKAIWHPALDSKRNSLSRWMDEDVDLPDAEARRI
jgi:hypothetical protein